LYLQIKSKALVLIIFVIVVIKHNKKIKQYMFGSMHVPTGFLVVVGEQTLRGQARVGFPGFDPERAGLGGTDGLIQLPNVTRQQTPRLDL